MWRRNEPERKGAGAKDRDEETQRKKSISVRLSLVERGREIKRRGEGRERERGVQKRMLARAWFGPPFFLLSDAFSPSLHFVVALRRTLSSVPAVSRAYRMVERRSANLNSNTTWYRCFFCYRWSLGPTAAIPQGNYCSQRHSCSSIGSSSIYTVWGIVCGLHMSKSYLRLCHRAILPRRLEKPVLS